MTYRAMVLLALLSAVDPGVSAQSRAASASPDFAVALLDQPAGDGVSRIWLAVRNTGQNPRLFCRTFWSYRWIPENADSPPVGEADSSRQRCDDDQGAWWLVLPGEWRFDSVTVQAPPDAPRELQVVVGLIERNPGRAGSSEWTVSWSRPVPDAVALGDKLKAGQFP